MNLHPVLGPILAEAKAAAQEAMGKANDEARLAEYRFAYVETFLRALDRDGFEIVPKDSGRRLPETKQSRLSARFELRQWLRDRVRELDIVDDVDLADQQPVELVDLEDVLDLLGDPPEEVNAYPLPSNEPWAPGSGAMT